MLRACCAVLAALVLGLAASGASALDFSNLYVFGDSIVDVGSTQNLAGGPGSPGDPTPAGAGYFDGRFTNGWNPADVLNIAIEGVAMSDLGRRRQLRLRRRAPATTPAPSPRSAPTPFPTSPPRSRSTAATSAASPIPTRST